ncbi:enoyl-CoA hydratase/isomerase family protein [Candidimonas sp. SYP-B2681]|uniref:enoyl-CoA hydratase/isomerase family protein n=1 Tax=Candidimonas sp. SYP-B2681 TaxID=2497686 RepID=UPI000F87127F|nr:enoyl-CoA hydratase/isomerase family protein [Candidimonas sp. SYP-B2681]RTZ47965.1 enoyl-CoA hydratase/isomerase family protein [Candidimonas sp. SYP-B2681]
MNSPVLFEVLDTASNLKVGVATLNSPETLNGLSLQMCNLLAEQLNLWEKDQSIALVILKGAGDKAFCAGGDLHGLYQAMQENTSGQAWKNAYARKFFDDEYRLDYQIHTYPKPILCWGSGIVMGGGVGLMMGASHRVATDTTRFAMPEISIGLFPDVGGTWMLARLPGGLGLFLALTGAQLGANDCYFLGLADYRLESTQLNELVGAIQSEKWSDVRDDNDIRLRRLLLAHQPQSEWPQGPLQKNYSLIRQCCDGMDFDAICRNILSWADDPDPWLKRAANTFSSGSPGSARLCFALLNRTRLLSLAGAFRQEYIVSLHCGAEGDFQEGIRALLVDKDKRPRWEPATLELATDAWVQRFFQQPWPDSESHPLADLGQTTLTD